MDLSTLFKASLKTASLRNKALKSNSSKIESKSKILKRQSPLITKLQSIVTQITNLHQLLVDNRDAYLNFSNFLPNKAFMTDAQRDEIDSNAQNIMGMCSQLIKELKREIVAEETTPQVQEHREIMLMLVETYLRNVCKIYSEQKVIRMKRVNELQRFTKLESNVPKLNNRGEGDRLSKAHSTSGSTDENDANTKSSMKIQEINEDIGFTDDEKNELSPEDIQMFEAENEQLYNNLNALAEEVREIESKVVYISELQEVFTEKILEQDKGVDRLMTTVIGSTENVKEANEQIRQAIQRNAGLRVYILFFLLVMSFTLLFLDWYND